MNLPNHARGDCLSHKVTFATYILWFSLRHYTPEENPYILLLPGAHEEKHFLHQIVSVTNSKFSAKEIRTRTVFIFATGEKVS